MTSWKPGEPVTIETERTVLRTMTPSDVTDRVAGWFSDPKVTAYLPMRKMRSKSRVQEWVSDHDNESNFLLGIYLKETDEQIGWHRVRSNGVRATTTLVIGEGDYRGQRFGFEVSTAVLAFIFEELRLHKVCRTAYGEDKNSHVINEKQGFTLEGVQREHKWRDGEWHDLCLYGMLASEWEARMANDDC